MTPQKLENYLNQIVKRSITLSIMIWGGAGIGKSSIVQNVARSQGLEFIDLRLSQLAPTDLRGLPVPSEGVTRWATPEFLPREGRGILFLDEINMAPPAMQGVAQQLILDRRVGGYSVPDGWFIWSAGNRKHDKASVFDMPAPLANRFVHLNVEPCIESFRSYAFKQSFDQTVIAFLAFRQELLHKYSASEMAWPSPRSWEMANTLYVAGLSVGAAVGDAAASEFYAYKDVTEKIPSIDSILAGKQGIDFPIETSLRYATVMALVGQSTDVDKAVNGLRWLINSGLPEWVQLYATDAFPLFRERGIMDEVQKKMMEDDKLRGFLSDYVRLLTK